MATTPPNNFKDPYWAELSASAERKHGLPAGLLVNIVQKGERSNNDQVSEAKARTVYQITDNTRKLVLDKYGIDPLLSPENAADAAALLLKEGLQRNKGDVAQAVGEYHGGTDRSNWGPRTRAYIARVVNSQPKPPDQGDSGSTFSRALSKSQAQKGQGNQIAMVYDAYKSGQMAPEEAAEFEADVKSGAVMLPRGASLNGQQAEPKGTGVPEPVMLPQAISDAYQRGDLSEQERGELEADIRSGAVKLPPSGVQQIPVPGNQPAPTEMGIIARQQEPTLSQRLLGAGEAGLTAVTGATGGALGMVAGTVEGITKSILDGTYGTGAGAAEAGRIAAERAGQLTYAPRTEQGMEQAQMIGEAAGALAPLGGLTGEMATLARGVQGAKPAMQATTGAIADLGRETAQQTLQRAKPAVASAVESVRSAPRRAAEAVGLMEAAPKAVSEVVGGVPQRASIGAAGVADEALRSAKAEGLPVPVNLTRGALTRDAEQLAFEKEQLKSPSLGKPLRDRAEENNLQALQNFDALIDMTGATAPDLATSGNKVVRALSDGYKNAKTQVRTAYKEAEKAGELEVPAKLDEMATFLKQTAPEAEVAPILKVARQKGVALGLLEEGPNGELIAKEAPLKNVELFRRSINESAGVEPTNKLFAGRMRDVIDTATEGLGGDLYAKARALRQQQARKYENRAVVARLITNRRGMDDPKVAVDQVFNKTVLNGSPEEITFLKRVLNTSGEEGQQAWKELKGSTIQYLRDEATKGMGMDSADKPIISPAKLHNAVSKLDKNDRLEIVLGKKGAETVRDLNDVVRYVNTVPPGTLINNSGTTGTLMAAIAEAGTTGALTGLPIPVISGLRMLKNEIKDAKIKARISRALMSSKTEAKKDKSTNKF